MRHQNRFLFALVLPLVMLAGCAKDDSTDPATDTGGEITFSIGFAGDEQNAQEPQTRVATDALFNSTWENGDAIGIFAVATGTTLSATVEDNYINNVRLTYNASANTWTPDQPLYWPADGGRLDFYAYHPWDGLENDPTAIDFTVHLGQHGTADGTPGTKSNFNASDLLSAKSNNGGAGFGKTTTSVPLTFAHALAMVQVTLDNTTGLLDTSGDITVTLRGARPTAALDLGAGTGGTATVDGTVAQADITMHRATDPDAPAALVFRALIPAQTLPQGASLFRTTDGTRILVSPPLAAAITLTPGRAEKFGQQMPVPITNNRITWRGGRYALTTDPHDAGLYFKFGSVVGVFSSNHGNQILPGTNSDNFDTGDVAWSPVDVTGWGDVPVYNDYPANIDADYHTVANVKAGKGDPCRLVGLDLAAIEDAADADDLTPEQIDNGTWRLPTNAENGTFVGASTVWQTLDGVWGRGFPSDDTFLPAAGFRDYSTGSVSYQGSLGYYWSSTANSGSFGYNLYFPSTTVYPSGSSRYAYGFGVRCVRQK